MKYKYSDLFINLSAGIVGIFLGDIITYSNIIEINDIQIKTMFITDIILILIVVIFTLINNVYKNLIRMYNHSNYLIEIKSKEKLKLKEVKLIKRKPEYNVRSISLNKK